MSETAATSGDLESFAPVVDQNSYDSNRHHEAEASEAAPAEVESHPVPAAEDDDDDFIEYVGAMASHERPPRSDQIFELLDDEENISESAEAESSVRPNDAIRYSQSSKTECTICLDDLTSEGPHRIVATRCGHLYGQSCLKKMYSVSKKYKCPQCQTVQTAGHEIVLYCANIKVVDIVEINKLKSKHADEMYNKIKDLTEKAKIIAKLEEEKRFMLLNQRNNMAFLQQAHGLVQQHEKLIKDVDIMRTCFQNKEEALRKQIGCLKRLVSAEAGVKDETIRLPSKRPLSPGGLQGGSLQVNCRNFSMYPPLNGNVV